MDLKQLGIELAKIGLPLLGAALPVPGGAAIGAALASHIGAKDSKPESILTALTQSPELAQKAREFEALHTEKLLAMTLDAEKAANQATLDGLASARDMKMKTGSTMPEQINYLFVGSTILITVGLLKNWFVLPTEPHLFTIVMLFINYVLLEAKQSVSFWISTTFQSKSKDETIKNLSGE